MFMAHLQVLLYVFPIVSDPRWCNDWILHYFKTYFSTKIVWHFTFLQEHMIVPVIVKSEV